MNLRRLVGGAIAAALTATTLGLATATPASAADENCTVSVSVQNKSGSANLQYGAYASIWAYSYSSCPDGSPDVPLGGATYLQRSIDGGRTWVNVKTSGSSYAAYYGSGYVSRTSWFRTYYTGGTSGSTGYVSHYPAAVSAPIRVGVYRKVAHSDRSVRGGLEVTFAIKPRASIKGLYVKFQVYKRGAWRTYKRIRANRRGVVRTVFSTTRYPGTAYRMILPAKRGYIRSYLKFRAYHY